MQGAVLDDGASSDESPRTDLDVPQHHGTCCEGGEVADFNVVRDEIAQAKDSPSELGGVAKSGTRGDERALADHGVGVGKGFRATRSNQGDASLRKTLIEVAAPLRVMDRNEHPHVLQAEEIVEGKDGVARFGTPSWVVDVIDVSDERHLPLGLVAKVEGNLNSGPTGAVANKASGEWEGGMEQHLMRVVGRP